MRSLDQAKVFQNRHFEPNVIIRWYQDADSYLLDYWRDPWRRRARKLSIVKLPTATHRRAPMFHLPDVQLQGLLNIYQVLKEDAIQQHDFGRLINAVVDGDRTIVVNWSVCQAHGN